MDSSVTAVAQMCEIYYQELTYLKSFFIFIISFTNFLTHAVTYDIAVMWPHYFWVE